jgi:hypothetical protein
MGGLQRRQRLIFWGRGLFISRLCWFAVVKKVGRFLHPFASRKGVWQSNR